METLKSGALVGGKYYVTELLGSGGMGQVYHARHNAVPQFEVAIKVLDPGLAARVESRERFRQEVLAGYRVNHPHVVRMYEYFDEPAVQAFAMEFINGGALFDVMVEGALSIPVGLSFLKQIALGLAALHREGTYHRDLKPENVLLTSEGVVKLTDFGIAHVRGGSRLEDEGFLAGTPRYFPPEYVEHQECDHRGDIYALGVIAYEMFCGCPPFRSTTRTSLLKERLEPHGLDLHDRVPSLPIEVIAVVERCLAVNPIQRWPHAMDVAKAIAGIQRTYSIEDVSGARPGINSTRAAWTRAMSEYEKERAVSRAEEELT